MANTIFSGFIPFWYKPASGENTTPEMIEQRRQELKAKGEEPSLPKTLTPVKAAAAGVGVFGLLLAGLGLFNDQSFGKMLGIGAVVLGAIGWLVDKFFVGSPQNPNELTQAVRNNDIAKVEELIKQGFDVNKKDDQGFTPLIISAGLGNAKIVKLLIDAGADVNLCESQMGASPLHKAAQSGSVEIAEMLIAKGAVIDFQNSSLGHTPLMDAIWHEKEDLVKDLLKKGAKTDIVASDTWTVFTAANKSNDRTKYRAILTTAGAVEQPATPQTNDPNLELFNAVKANDLAKVKELIKKGGIDLNQRANGLTPLLRAAIDGSTDIVKVLLEAGADLNAIDLKMKSTAAHKAAYMGRPEVMKLLIKAGIDKNAQGPYNGYTPLHDAIWHGHQDGHRETIHILLEAGVRLDLRTHNGKTPLELAKELGFDDIVKMIEAEMKKRGIG